MTSHRTPKIHVPRKQRQQLLFAAVVLVSGFQARAQHLTFVLTQVAPSSASLIEAASAPERFASFLPEPAFVPPVAAPAALLTFAEASPNTSLLETALPLSPSSLLPSESASLQPDTLESPATVEAGDEQFSSPDPRTMPKAPDGRPIAPLYTKYIPAGWAYQPIHGREKLILGARDLYSPANFLAMIAAAGWSHLNNGQPNYGTDKGAFGQRLGAAALRQTAQGIFTDGVFAVMFHQDPRYFAEGPKYGFLHRALYAATRPIIVRTTNGTGSTVNSSLLAGYAAAALLNDAYYPASNRNVHDTLASYGGSIGGAALGFVVSEFTDDTLILLHLKHKP